MPDIIEQYAEKFSALDTSQKFKDLFDVKGSESCPLEGKRTLGEYADGLKAFNEKNIKEIKLLSVITKKDRDEAGEILKGVMIAKVFFNVNMGEKSLDYYCQVITARGNKIIAIDSFWRP